MDQLMELAGLSVASALVVPRRPWSWSEALRRHTPNAAMSWWFVALAITVVMDWWPHDICIWAKGSVVLLSTSSSFQCRRRLGSSRKA